MCSLVVVPVGSVASAAAFGVYWAKLRVPDVGTVEALERLPGHTAEAIERVGLDDAPWAPNFRQFVEQARRTL